MKKITFITFFFAIFTANSFSEIEYNKWQVVYELDIRVNGYGTACTYIGIDRKKNSNLIAVANINIDATHIIVSQDSGKSWDIKLKDTIFGQSYNKGYQPFKTNALFVVDETLALAVCDSGSYWRSTDNGETWYQHFVENRKRIWQIGFWDNKTGLMFQSRFGEVSTVSKTTDGGLNWFDSPAPKALHKTNASYLFTLGKGIAYAIEVDNKVDSVYYFHKSTDYGETWQPAYKGLEVPPGGNFYFYNENLGFCFGGQQLNYTAKGKLIRRTSDGGHTWERVLEANMNNDEITDVHFSDSLNGIAASITNIFRTSDGGKTWAEDTTYNYKRDPRISLIYMIDKDNVIGLSTNSNNKVMRFTYKDPTFVVDNYKVTQFQIFPNPATSKININISDESIADHEYSIFDIKGRVVKKGILNKSIDVEELNTGTYYLIIIEGDIIYYSKFVKE